MQCCPLSGNDDGDSGHLLQQRVVVARKEHQCTECGEDIKRGEKYELYSGVWDDSISTYKTCLICVELRDHFACNGWIFGSMWHDLAENFFPDMRAGGQCMDGLSPAARMALIDARMVWYLSHAEVDDSKWEGDRWRPAAERAPRLAPAFIPPAYAMLEYEPCTSIYGCRVMAELDVMRRGGLNELGTGVIAADVQTAEQRIRDAERWCRKMRLYTHAESIVPVDPKEDLHG